MRRTVVAARTRFFGTTQTYKMEGHSVMSVELVHDQEAFVVPIGDLTVSRLERLPVPVYLDASLMGSRNNFYTGLVIRLHEFINVQQSGEV